MKEKKLRIVFMGTPDFAVESLKQIHMESYDIAGVITAPDRPAGRGQKLRPSPVKKFALQEDLNILQPENLKDKNFLNELKALEANLFVVVAFRMLPKEVWSMPEEGTFNLHASLLPQYRGAAPINWAIINGEEKTGVTTFFLDEKIDTGKIIHRKTVDIFNDDTAGSLHDRLMQTGAALSVKTVKSIESGNYTPKEQKEFIDDPGKLKPAPKIFKEDCKINWNKSGRVIYDFIRGLSPYPTAWTVLIHKETGKKISLKVFFASFETTKHSSPPGKLEGNPERESIRVSVKDGFIEIEELQLSGKKKMNADAFLRGFPLEDYQIEFINQPI